MANNKEKKEDPRCLVIMPFSDPKGYEPGHFRKIYDQILAPAIEKAGYSPHRIDENAESTMIHAKLLEQLINAPMVLCDLSSKNPNVLYELGIRHAFDKPVVLVQEKGQERIFDIAGLTTAEYRKERLYDEVLVDQDVIADAIKQTANATRHSIMSLVSLAPAEVNHSKEISVEDRMGLILDDIARKLNRIEAKMPNEVVPVEVLPSERINAGEVINATNRLMYMDKLARRLVSLIKTGEPVETSRLKKTLAELEEAIALCRRIGCSDTMAYNDARLTRLELQGLLMNKKEEISV